MKLVSGFSEKKYLFDIIRICRMKPYDAILNKDLKVKLHNVWVDEYGSTIRLKNKKPYVVKNDVKIDRTKLVSTDQYGGLKINQVAKISNLMYIVSGLDEESYEKMYMVAFIGVDGFIRNFILEEGWIQVSPLWLGMPHLKNIATNLGCKKYKIFENEKEYPFPCVSLEAWITYLPSDEEFFQKMKRHETILELMR